MTRTILSTFAAAATLSIAVSGSALSQVDGRDFLVWKRNFGAPATQQQGKASQVPHGKPLEIVVVGSRSRKPTRGNLSAGRKKSKAGHMYLKLGEIKGETEAPKRKGRLQNTRKRLLRP